MKFSFLFLLLLSTTTWARWSVTTYNIRNFDDDSGAGPTNIQELAKVIRNVQSDVMAFEEVVDVPEFERLIKSVLPGYEIVLSTCGGFGKQNLGVVYNPRVFKFLSKNEDRSFTGGNSGACGNLRPVMLVGLEHIQSRVPFVFGVVHLKAGSDERSVAVRWQQYEMLKRLSKALERQNLILLGDFNTTGYISKNEDYVRFEDFLSSSRLRAATENIACTNYWQGTLGGPEFQPSILDHVILQDRHVSQIEMVGVAAHCAKRQCRPSLPQDLGATFQSVSDHCPVKVSFK